MKRRQRSSLPLVAAILAATAGAAGAQQNVPYTPGLGDLMTMTVQPRHTKLGLAIREANWRYAAFALEELEEAFERIGEVWPKWHEFTITDMIGSVIRDPMAALEQAIKAADATGAAAAYGQLTVACNTCHRSADRSVIVIQAPLASAFPDQDFRPVKE